MKKLLVVLLAIAIVSCKSETKENVPVKEDIKEVEVIAKELQVEFNFKTNKEADFKLSVNNIIKDEFQKKSVVITEKVAPSSSMETINANFGENIISNSIRFDVGNKEVKQLEIGSIDFKYGSNVLSVQPSELAKYFRINKFIDYDPETGILKTQKVEGKHYPAISLKRSAINLLTKE